MRLVTYRKGSSKPRVGALVDDAGLSLGFTLLPGDVIATGTRIGVLTNKIVAP